ncbi:unnamed protein product [Anisakis simplex]|uniref:Sterol 4-C-methyltransferase strm-1 (inferred by orthology to a C. elegans protein) n=1 Tax=Anisakis simplex TaxID=6269 RepID=A0A0M3KAJ5_ANISI|nr:unnamed protein product [Anisakis simplex]
MRRQGHPRRSVTYSVVVKFRQEHDRLYAEAKRTSDYLAVTSHYYSVMSQVIDDYFNGNFHFSPPQFNGQSFEEALNALHLNIAKCLKLDKDKKCLDIGCGIGTVMKELSTTGANLTGLTIAANEVHMGNEVFRSENIKNCNIIEGDCHDMPFVNDSFDCAYAIYSLKYLVNLLPVMREISRILKSDGLLVIYDLLKTKKFDKNSSEHRRIIEGIEYACGMPSLHTRQEMIAAASECNLELIEAIDLDAYTGYPFHYCFSNSKFFMWLVR